MKAHLLNFTEALTHHAVIDIAERCNLHIRQRSISFDVAFASAAQSDDRHANAVIRTQHSSRRIQGAEATGNRYYGRRLCPTLQKLSPAVIHIVTVLLSVNMG